MKHTMLLETNEAHNANAKEHNMLLPKMKYNMEPQTNKTLYATANKWFANVTANKRRKICNCKQMKHTVQQQKNEAYYANANKW